MHDIEEQATQSGEQSHININIDTPGWLSAIIRHSRIDEYQSNYQKNGYDTIASIDIGESINIWVRYCYGDYDRVNGWIDITMWKNGSEIGCLDPVYDLDTNTFEFGDGDDVYSIDLRFVE